MTRIPLDPSDFQEGYADAVTAFKEGIEPDEYERGVHKAVEEEKARREREATQQP